VFSVRYEINFYLFIFIGVFEVLKRPKMSALYLRVESCQNYTQYNIMETRENERYMQKRRRFHTRNENRYEVLKFPVQISPV
jgi:hypothetical protein